MTRIDAPFFPLYFLLGHINLVVAENSRLSWEALFVLIAINLGGEINSRTVGGKSGIAISTSVGGDGNSTAVDTEQITAAEVGRALLDRERTRGNNCVPRGRKGKVQSRVYNW